MLYKVYWDRKKFLSFDKFYEEYLNEHGTDIKRFQENKELKRFPNGFIVFAPYAFEQKKKEIDEILE